MARVRKLKNHVKAAMAKVVFTRRKTCAVFLSNFFFLYVIRLGIQWLYHEKMGFKICTMENGIVKIRRNIGIPNLHPINDEHEMKWS